MTAEYRFLPWTRRGLAAMTQTPDTPGDLPGRAPVHVAITVTSIAERGLDLRLYGPGDVIGVDPRLVVRTDPRPLSTDVEPNYFAQIEFDPPDFPWLFTPARSGPNEHLRPWCALIVVDLSVVAAPRLEPSRPLPVVRVPRNAVATELPDLSESWAWAHAQLLTNSATTDVPAELTQHPALNVSRIVCPRRLEPDKRYAACLVPTFDLGVARGLGDNPAPDAVAKPAWNNANAADVVLPVYYHWEFATGAAGDFELLARRLKPLKVAATVGTEPMYVGDAQAGMPRISPADPTAYMNMEGALRAPTLGDSALSAVVPAVRDALRAALNEPAKLAAQGAATKAAPNGPPLYGEWPAKQHTIPDTTPAWFRDLNLDPRMRAAAGLGAEVVRANQEQFMQWCWEQVGKILDASALLGRARLATETGARLQLRHYATQPPDRLMQLTAPAHGRVVLDQVTVRARVAATSLPDAALDPAMRRQVSAQRPALKQAARRANVALPASASLRSRALSSLADGSANLDPSRFSPSGIAGVPGLARIAVPAAPDATVDLTSLGLPLQTAAARVSALRAQTTALQSAPPPVLTVRSDIRIVGMVGDAHITAVRDLVGQATSKDLAVNSTFDALLTASRAQPGAAALLLTAQGSAAPAVDALDVDTQGQVVIRTPAGQPAIPLATIDPAAMAGFRTNVGAMLTTLPANTLDRTAGGIPNIAADPQGRAMVVTPTLVRTPRAGTVAGPIATVVSASVTVPPLIKDPSTISRFETAFQTAAPTGVVGPADVVKRLVTFNVAGARPTLIQRIDPRTTILKRVTTMVFVGGSGLLTTPRPQRVAVAPAQDRVLAFPEIDVPTYTYLAQLDRARFLPGVDGIPADAITLVETNPRFVEAFLVGANHEMGREMLWRAFPTDQAGTPLQHFWTWHDGGADIPPIHLWRPPTALGGNSRTGVGGQLVLLVRGRLLQRYPNTTILAWRAKGTELKPSPGPDDTKLPVFDGFLPPDIAFVGFDLKDADLKTGDGWFFVLQQQPSEPRFGFDEPKVGSSPTTLVTWSDASWQDVGVPPGRHLRIEGNALTGRQMTGARFVDNGAHLATITLQKPMRVAIHGRDIVALP